MKLKIVNHRKFRCSLILTVVIFGNILLNLNNTSSSETLIDYKTVTVNYGDTLWSIAKYEQEKNNYYKNDDIRKIISDIKEINNMKSSNLTEGQTLKIPTNFN